MLFQRIAPTRAGEVAERRVISHRGISAPAGIAPPPRRKDAIPGLHPPPGYPRS